MLYKNSVRYGYGKAKNRTGHDVAGTDCGFFCIEKGG